MTPRLIQKAEKTRACCDKCGRLAALARAPVQFETLVARAVARGQGSAPVVRTRIRDMLASRLLVEVKENRHGTV